MRSSRSAGVDASRNDRQTPFTFTAMKMFTGLVKMFSGLSPAYRQPIVRIDASVPASRVAEALGGEIVQKGANLHLWQTKGNAALYKVAPWVTAHGGIGRASEGLLQIVLQPRAYIESITGPGRTPDVAQNLRERMIASNA